MRAWQSYLRVTDSWNVPVFLGCRPQGWINSKSFWSIFSSMLVSLELRPFLYNLQKIFCSSTRTNKASVSEQLFTLSNHEHYCTIHKYCMLSLKEHHHYHNGASQCTVYPLISLCFLSISQSEKCKMCSQPTAKSLLFMDVLMPDDLVGNPVEDIEDEESQRKSGPWDCVDPLGSVHKLFPHGVYVLWGWLLRVGSWNSIFNSGAILCWQTLAHVVAGKIKAAFTQIVILKSDMHMWMSLLDLFKSLQLRC